LILRSEGPVTGTTETIARKFHLISFQLRTIKFLCTTIKWPFVVVVVVFVGQTNNVLLLLIFRHALAGNP